MTAIHHRSTTRGRATSCLDAMYATARSPSTLKAISSRHAIILTDVEDRYTPTLAQRFALAFPTRQSATLATVPAQHLHTVQTLLPVEPPMLSKMTVPVHQLLRPMETRIRAAHAGPRPSCFAACLQRCASIAVVTLVYMKPQKKYAAIGFARVTQEATNPTYPSHFGLYQAPALVYHHARLNNPGLY